MKHKRNRHDFDLVVRVQHVICDGLGHVIIWNLSYIKTWYLSGKKRAKFILFTEFRTLQHLLGDFLVKKVETPKELAF